MAWFQKPHPRELEHKMIVLGLLQRLKTMSAARGCDLDFDANRSLKELDALLWDRIEGLAVRLRLDFPDNMPAESRLDLIGRALPPVPRRMPPGQGFGDKVNLFTWAR
jgi:hypothetical protein